MKINTNALRKEIQSELSEMMSSVIYQRTIRPIGPPYAVFDIKPLQTIDGRTQCRLEVDLFDTDAENIEDTADLIEEFYDHYDFRNTKVAFYTYRGQRQSLVDEDKTIRRIRLTFELYLYSKEA